MKLLTSVLFILVFAMGILAQAPSLSPDDLKALEGKRWVGTLTYLDYSSNKKTAIKSNVTISRSPNSKSAWIFQYQYPDEPKADSKAELILSADGRQFDTQTVVEKSVTPGVGTRIVTTKPGMDNDRKALYRYTYQFGEGKFSLRKEVKIEGSDEYFERNTYSWTRAN